jgi:HAD superfamily hydrolase (TIGR01509 family)
MATCHTEPTTSPPGQSSLSSAALVTPDRGALVGVPERGLRDDTDPGRRARTAETLAASWLSAFAKAETAIRGNGAHLSSAEVGDRMRRLRAEREETAALLEGLAHGQRAATLLARCVGRPTFGIQLLGLPNGVNACIFDVEGALTTSAAVHRDAWCATLDTLLFARAERLGREFVPFDPRHDYSIHLAGRPRLTGLRSFLASRGISVPEGEPSDRPETESVHGLANRKQEVLRRYLQQQGVEAFAGSRAYLEVARLVGARRAVVSASTNTRLVLQLAGIADLIEERVDGPVLEAEALRPKPAPDTLLAACARLDVDPRQAAAFETTPAGISAARAAGVRTVVGVAGEENAGTLSATDADLVVDDLGELLERALSS